MRRLAGLGNWVREFFTLGQAERSLARLPLYDRIEMREAIRVAIQVMREAERTRVVAARSCLAKQALERLVVAIARAQLTMRDEIPVDWPDTETAIRIVSDLPQLACHASALAFVGTRESVPLLDDSQFELVADFFALLERLADTRTERDFRATRWFRASSAALLLIAGGWIAYRPCNLARGKVVSASSLCGDMPAAPLGARQLVRVVDGVRRELRYAACTNSELHPWLTVDLGAIYDIKEVVVYPRTDGKWGQADVPVQIRMSLDNKDFQVKGQQTVPYTFDYPWQLPLRSTRARFVQLRGSSEDTQQLYVNEFEVYGR
jgi:hypothetical protein